MIDIQLHQRRRSPTRGAVVHSNEDEEQQSPSSKTNQKYRQPNSFLSFQRKLLRVRMIWEKNSNTSFVLSILISLLIVSTTLKENNGNNRRRRATFGKSIDDLSTLGYKSAPRETSANRGMIYILADRRIFNTMTGRRRSKHPILPVHRVHEIPRKHHHRQREEEHYNVFWEMGRNHHPEHRHDEENDALTNLYAKKPECVPMHEWQTKSYPNCNVMHEQTLTTIQTASTSRLLASGWWRMTFRTYNQDEPIAYKTMRYERPLSKFVVDKHRIDAIIYDRMTKSEYIMDIYGYCGFAGLFEYAEAGQNLEELIFGKENRNNPLSKLERLELALDVANGLADLHSIDSVSGHSAFVHTDLIINQYVRTGDKFKLNDFNRGHLMYWNATSNIDTCPYIYDELNPGVQRSPEEYFYSEQTEKIDTFSMGNIFYMILTDEHPFDEQYIEMEKAQELVKKGIKSKLSKRFIQSNDPVDRALLKAMSMCFVHDWRERYSSVEVRDFLTEELRKIRAH